MKVESADAVQMRKHADDKLHGEQNEDDDKDEEPISIDDALTTLLHDKEMKRVVLGIYYSTFYFSLFIAMLFSHIPASSTMYELGYSISSTLASSGADTVTSDSTIKFNNIQTLDDTFDWLTDTFVPSVFVTEDYNGKALEKDKWGRVAKFNKVLGAVIFETTRAQIHLCQAQKFLQDLYPNCYDPNNIETNSLLISFDTNVSDATSEINKLKANGTWLDFATQSLVITIVMYNGEIQGYAATELTLEFNQGGSVEPSSSTTPTLADPYKDSSGYALDVIVALCWLAAQVDCIATVRRHVRQMRAPHATTANWLSKYLPSSLEKMNHDINSTLAMMLSIKNIVNALVVLFYVAWYLIVSLMADKTFRDNLARLVVTGKKFDANSDERNGLIAVTDSLKYIAHWTVVLRVLAVLTVLAMGLRILQTFHAHPKLGVLTRTIASALRQFRWVFGVFVVIFVTFSVAGTVLFGDRVEGFSSMDKSLETCINMLFGSFDYATIQNVYRPASMIFYWAYMIIVSLVLLNMMLAIVVDAYAEVSSEKNQETKNTSTSRAEMSISWDLVLMPFELAHRVRRIKATARQTTRDFLQKGTNMMAPASMSELISEYRDLSEAEVVSRGRIKSRLLLKLLESVCKSPQSGVEARSGEVGKDLLTAKKLQEWFAGAKITDAVARQTLKYIRDGMCSSDTASSSDSSEIQLQRPSDLGGEVRSYPQDDGKANKSKESESSEAELPRATADASRCGAIGDVSSLQPIELLKKIDALERKLDLLLTRVAAE